MDTHKEGTGEWGVEGINVTGSSHSLGIGWVSQG